MASRKKKMTLHVHFAPFLKHLEKRFIVSLDDRKWYNGRYLLMCIFHSLFDILVTSINSTLRYSTWWLITHEKNNRFCCIWLSFLISYILCNIKNYLQFVKVLGFYRRDMKIVLIYILCQVEFRFTEVCILFIFAKE